MIDSTQLKAHRTAASSIKKALPRLIGRTKGVLNSKLHVVCDEAGKPRHMVLTEGQMKDHKGARLLIERLPLAKTLIGERGYHSNWSAKR